MTTPAPIAHLNPPMLPDASAFGHSQVTIMQPGAMVFISGQVAWQPGDQPTPTDLAEQARLVRDNARIALAAAGVAPGDLVMVRVYVVDLTPARLQLVMPILLDLLDGARPSLTGIGVAALAGPDLQLEIELIARLPD